MLAARTLWSRTWSRGRSSAAQHNIRGVLVVGPRDVNGPPTACPRCRPPQHSPTAARHRSTKARHRKCCRRLRRPSSRLPLVLARSQLTLLAHSASAGKQLPSAAAAYPHGNARGSDSGEVTRHGRLVQVSVKASVVKCSLRAAEATRFQRRATLPHGHG